MTSVKFADPSNPSVVWDRMLEPMPEWIRAHLASGQFLNDWLIKEETAPIDLKPLRNSEQFKQTDWASDNCPVCMNPLPRNATGRPPVHCSNACKQSAYRLRNALRNSDTSVKPLRNSKRNKIFQDATIQSKIFGHSVLGSVPKIFAITAHDDLKSVEGASNTHTKVRYPELNDKKLGG